MFSSRNSTPIAHFLVILLSLFFLFIVQSASAATLVVTTTADELSVDSDCSLREAVINANENSDVYPECGAGEPGSVATDIIVLASATYPLTLTCGMQSQSYGSSAECGDLDVTDSLIVRGVTGANATVIRVGEAIIANGYSSYHRIFDLRASNSEPVQSTVSFCDGTCQTTSLTVEDVTLENGYDCDGGAIRAVEDDLCSVASLTLNRVIVQDNIGECFAGGIYSRGILSVNDSTISGNLSYGDGGGVYYGPAYFCQGEITSSASFSSSTVSGNETDYGSGGGIFNSFGSNTTISNTTISDNGARFAGGGIANEFADMTITDSTISDNHGVTEADPESNFLSEEGPIFGGGIYNLGSVIGGETMNFAEIPPAAHELNIQNTAITNNTAQLAGGGISNNAPIFGCESRERDLFEGTAAAVTDLLGFCQGIADISSANIAEELEVVVNVSGSTISGNQAFAGGGIHHGILTAAFNIDTTTISDNVSPLGGGILNRWVMNVETSTISGNNPGEVIQPTGLLNEFVAQEETSLGLLPIPLGGGGGVLNLGHGEFENTTISGNETQGSGAGILNLTGPLYYIFYLITNPELFPEPTPTASPTPAAAGEGGIFFGEQFDALPAPGTFLRSVTVTGNEIVPFAIPPAAGSLQANGGEISLDGISLVNNGGGIATYFGQITVRNSIVAGNSDDQENIDILFEEFNANLDPSFFFEEAEDFAPDCYEFQNFLGLLCEEYLAESPYNVEEICAPLTPALTSEFYNLIGDNTGCTPFNPENEDADKVGTGESPIDPLLGPLSDNGGPTLTHYPLFGSQAIDMANPTGEVTASVAGEADFACPAADQLGLSRPIDGDLNGTATCDIGAVEARVDCNGVPQGTAVLDVCGVCGGDGSLCAPTPTPTPTPTPPADLTVQCTEVDITADQFSLDGAGLEQVALNRQLANRAKRQGARGTRKYVIMSQDIYESAVWASTWSLSNVQMSDCTGGLAAQCLQVSNVSALQTVTNGSNDLNAIAKKLLRRLARNGASKSVLRKLRNRADHLNNEVLSLLSTIPTETTQCNF
ncbi:MAG: CSLREA domain-containing protein [Bdellovibrionales bacterium]|nr:CSLREA domain-containing protein [Bdellovibrionales bacterium]